MYGLADICKHKKSSRSSKADMTRPNSRASRQELHTYASGAGTDRVRYTDPADDQSSQYQTQGEICTPKSHSVADIEGDPVSRGGEFEQPSLGGFTEAAGSRVPLTADQAMQGKRACRSGHHVSRPDLLSSPGGNFQPDNVR